MRDRLLAYIWSHNARDPAAELLRLKLLGWRIDSGVSFYERVTGRMYLRELRPSYMIFNPGFAVGRLSMAAKRLVDLSLSFFGLLCATPVLVLASASPRRREGSALEM